MGGYTVKVFDYSSHTIIARILQEANAQIILDTGCSEGFLKSVLLYNPKKLIGIDKNIEKKPQGYSQFIKADVEKNKFKLNNRFDAIVLADILEHLEKPQVLLRKLKPYIKDNGFILVSVPNMDFFLVKILKLLGIAPHMDRGLFDKTHKQEFTLKEIKSLLISNGFKITEKVFTPIPLPLISRLFNKGNFLYPIYSLTASITAFLPSIFAYQIILKAKQDDK